MNPQKIGILFVIYVGLYFALMDDMLAIDGDRNIVATESCRLCKVTPYVDEITIGVRDYSIWNQIFYPAWQIRRLFRSSEELKMEELIQHSR